MKSGAWDRDNCGKKLSLLQGPLTPLTRFYLRGKTKVASFLEADEWDGTQVGQTKEGKGLFDALLNKRAKVNY